MSSSGLHKNYGTDERKEVQGVRFSMGQNEDKSEIVFILSRASKTNKHYTQTLKRLAAPHQRAQELGTLSEEVAEDLMLDVFTQSLLKGWENVKDQFGNDLPFSPEAAKKLMLELPDVYAILSAECNKITLFRSEAQAAAAKN